MAERTLIWDVFDYIFEADRRRMGRLPAGQAGIKPIRTYRNPIFLAQEWAEAMEAANFRSQRAFAKAIGLSHARVSQMMSLLCFSPDVLKALEGLGDPMTSRTMTERMLRPIAKLPAAKQRQRLNEIVCVG